MRRLFDGVLFAAAVFIAVPCAAQTNSPDVPPGIYRLVTRHQPTEQNPITQSLQADECDVTVGNQTCIGDINTAITTPQGVGLCTTNCSSTYYDGVRSDPGQAGVPIDAWNICRYVDNNSANSIFVPFRQAVEWGADATSPQWGFTKNPPQNVILTHCARPYTPVIPPDTNPGSPYYCGSPVLLQAPPPMTYARMGGPLITEIAQYTCTNTGPYCTTPTTWTEMATGVYAPGDSDTQNPSWILQPPVSYSGNVPGACGQCGAANGVATATPPWNGSPPIDYLCIGGGGINGSNNGTSWTWDCQGMNGGAPANCSAPLQAGTAGQCGTTQDACTAGTYAGDDSNDGTNYYWTCNGTSGGANASCSTPMPPSCIVAGTNLVGASCGPANGVPTATEPTSALCGPYFGGTSVLYVPPTSNGVSWSWECASVVCIADCSAPVLAGTDGQCGAANGVPDSNAPWGDGSNLCAVGGGINGTTDGKNWYWGCSGTNGGANSSCSAPIPFMCPVFTTQDQNGNPLSFGPASPGYTTWVIPSYCQPMSNYEVSPGHDQYQCQDGIGWVDIDSAFCQYTAIGTDGGTE